MATENKKETSKFIEWLNKAGKSWKDFWDTPVTIQYAYNPHAVVGNGGAPFSSTLRRGDFATLTAAAVAIPATAAGVATVGVVPTLVGMGVGMGTGIAADVGGSKLVELAGGDENALEMVGDIAGFTLGAIAGGKATKATTNYLNFWNSWLNPKSVYTTMSEALTPVKTSSTSVRPATNVKLTSHLQGDDAAQMFNEYASGYTLPATETENVRLLRAYVAEARERYGLVGNDKVSDETILKALYKHVDELGGNTAARNIDGEPLLLFRGDTRSYTELKPRVSPEELVTMSGTMDNSLGTLFLGELPGTGVKGQGLERYLVHGREFNGNKRLIGSGTGAHVVSPSGDRISEFDAVASFPQGSRYLVTHTTSRGIPHSYYKLPSTYSSTGVNDINGFVVRTPNMRNASKEISVLNDDFLVQASPDKVSYYGPKRRVLLDKDGFPLLVDESGNVVGNALAGSSERSAMAQHYRHVLDDAKLHNQGLLKSEGGSTNGIPGNYLRDEHTHFNYFALPNFNIQNAKHILPYDFRIPRDWSDPNIFRIVAPTALTLGGAGTAAYNIYNSQPLYQKQGGSIHIKKKNKGKFTDYCGGKVTEECIRKGKNSSNPTTRKRANFAWVARHKFKHEEGGKINYLNYFQHE